MPNATLTDLFGAERLLHYDASDASSLFTDTGGTIVATDGQEIRCWKPQAAATLQVNLTNSTGPTYRANYGGTGYPALEFDGVNDALLNASTGITTSQVVFVLCVFRSLNSFGRIWSRGNTGAWVSGYYATNAEHIQPSSGAGASIASGLPDARRVSAYVARDGQTQIDALGFSGGVRTNGLPSGVTGAFTIGALNTGSLSQFGAMAFNELVVAGSNCEWGQVLRAAKLLRAKWGITDPNATPQANPARPSHPLFQQVIG